MGSKVIKVVLSTESIDKALKELKEYKSDIASKTLELQGKIANRLADIVRTGFTGAIVDDLVKRIPRYAQVAVTVQTNGNLSVVAANGKDAVWVEFGAGVYHNRNLGGSPHPYGVAFGYIIGGYGQGKGKEEQWAFKDGNNEVKWTYGTPATMPMFNAMRTVCNSILEMAREVFSQ